MNNNQDLSKPTGSDDLVPDDPCLTAYALGEIQGREAERVRDAVAENPELNATVEAIRQQADQLRETLGNRLGEPGLSADRKEFVLATARKISWRMKSVAQEPRPLSARLRSSERELALFWSGLGAAAAVLIMVVWQVSTGHRERSHTQLPPNSLETGDAAHESSVVTIEFMEPAPSATASTPDSGAGVRRLPSGLATRDADGWWPVADVRPTGHAGHPAGDVRPSSAFPLWFDDASFELARTDLLDQQRLPEPTEVRVEEWIAAVNGEPVVANQQTGATGAARVSQDMAGGLRMTAEVASAPWQPEHDLVMLQVTLSGESLHQFRQGAQVSVEPNPLAVDAFRLIGFNRSSSTGSRSVAGVGGGDAQLREPETYTVTALAEVRRVAGAFEADLLRFKLEPVRGDDGEIYLPVLAVSAPEGSAPAWDMASHDFQAAAAAAELGLMLGGELEPAGYARLTALGAEGGVLGGNAKRRDLAAMIQAAASLQSGGGAPSGL